MRSAIQPINSSDLIELTNKNLKRFVSIDSVGHYAPSSSAVLRLSGYIDRAGNLYYENRFGVLVKRTAVNVNDNKKSFRVCIQGEKFYISIRMVDVNAYFSAKDNTQPTNSEYGYIVFNSSKDPEEIRQGFKTLDEALKELRESLEYWDELSFTGLVFQAAGKMTQKIAYDYE